ncbi:MAG: VOC family protein [Myxococcota bacterium]|nr:VOC family protein [Myxococcota bacterium]
MRILAVSALLLVCGSAGAQDVESLPPLPPLAQPETNRHLPGKIVWADLFTNDVDRARRFYAGVFGWEWRELTRAPQRYGLLYMGGQRVAGIAHLDPPDGQKSYARWVHFLSAKDVPATGKAILARGGEELLAPVSHAERGEFAIYAGPEKEVFGIVRSASGDPGDHQARIGEWIWWQLFTGDVKTSVASLQAVFGYDADEEEVTAGLGVVHLSAHGHARAVVGPLPEDDPQATSTWIGFVRVDDVKGTLAKVVANGGKVMLEPDPQILDGDIAVIADPAGTLLGVMRWDYAAQQGGARP